MLGFPLSTLKDMLHLAIEAKHGQVRHAHGIEHTIQMVDFVLDHLAEANFDPEFFDQHESEIVPALREQLS